MQPRLKLDPLQLGAISSDIEFQSSGSENPAQSIREGARSRASALWIAPSRFFDDANRFSRSAIRLRYAILARNTEPQS